MTKTIKRMVKETYEMAKRSQDYSIMLGCIDTLNRIHNTKIHKKDIKYKNRRKA